MKGCCELTQTVTESSFHIAKEIDPELADLSARLQRSLGTKVNIQPQSRGGKGGKIEISYYSSEELERLLDIFEGR